MPKPHFTEAPAHIRRRIDRARLETTIATPAGQGVMGVRAAGQLAAIETAYREGYDYRPEDVTTPILDQLRELEGAGEIDALARVKVNESIEIRYERRCLSRAAGMRDWAAKPSRWEEAEAAQLERDGAARELALQQRTEEIMASDKRSRAEKTLAAARRKAETEMQ